MGQNCAQPHAEPLEWACDMAKAKTEPKKKRSLMGVLLRLAVAVVAVYLLVTFISGQMRLAEKKRELEGLQAQVTLQAEKNQELLRMMEADNEDAYVERTAREKLGYARPSERVFVDLTGE